MQLCQESEPSGVKRGSHSVRQSFLRTTVHRNSNCSFMSKRFLGKHVWETMCACVCSVVWDFATPWTAVHQAPLSMGFSRQEYWSGVAVSFFRGIFPTQGSNLCLLHWILYHCTSWEALEKLRFMQTSTDVFV